MHVKLFPVHRLALRDWVNLIAMSPLVTDSARKRLLRKWGLTIGRRASISPGCYFGGADIAIGDHVRLNRGVYVDVNAPVAIGNGCHLAMECVIITSTHRIGPAACRAGEEIARPVTIGAGCWIGARAMILAGTTIGSGCIIAAGALVTSDCAPNGLYVGAPARRSRDL
jgi:acetyltransferase-like isoleucine patch superfamily enzyme